MEDSLSVDGEVAHTEAVHVIEEPQPTLLVRGDEEGGVEPGSLPARLLPGVNVEIVARLSEGCVVKRRSSPLLASS